MTVADDLGAAVPVTGAARRVVSLVPSLTEAIASADRAALVGATTWCTHPADLDVARVRGTKNPDVPVILDLRPDLVVANKEENRRRDVERLRAAGVPVWVTEITTVHEALASIRRLFTAGLRWPVPAWLTEADREWGGPPDAERGTVVIAVWRDPWMVVGRDTFTGDVVRHLGLRNLFGEPGGEGHAGRYPHTTVAEIRRRRPDVVVLPDEPYPFSPADGPEEFAGQAVALVEGRLLTWYGPSLRGAKALLRARLTEVRP
jgi:ABC-type Fe3+-hydroxamate transport system substrate-binding protein